MKKLFTFSIAVFIVSSIAAQTATSVANGNWFSPTTWGGTVPTPGYNVIINHQVTLTSNYGYSSGSITINSSGSLIQDSSPRALAQNGGSFSNAGTVTLSKMAFFSGTISNLGTLNSVDSLYLAINLNNTGTVYSSNLYNSGTLTNNNSINGINFFNDGTLHNNFDIGFTNHFNNSISYNDHNLSFNDYTNAGIFYNNINGFLSISNDCTNGDTINHDAHWYNNGHTDIWNNFTNIDTLDGNIGGTICVGFNSANFGAVLGTFDFCSHYSGTFDINSGTISNGITFCTGGEVCWSNVNENQNISNLNIFPNPVKESLTINLSNTKIKTVEIIDILGKTIYLQNVNSNEINISRNNIPSGTYFVKVNTTEKSYSAKVVFE